MKRWLFFSFLVVLMSCGRENNPVQPGSSLTGLITIVFVEDLKGAASPADSTNCAKNARPAVINSLEIRVLKSDNSLLVSKNDTPKNGRFEGTIEVKAQNDLKVLCIGKNNDVIERFGIDDDVDVKPGETTEAVITGWYEPFRPEIGSIKPNPSQDGTYTVSWTQPPNTTTYILQEADNEKFSGVATVYSGTDLQKSISGKTSGAYYYRVQSSNEYNVKSGWSASSSVVVSISQRKYTISGTVTGADGVLVTLSGDASDSTRVNSGGNYIFIVNENGSYTVTTSKTGFLFTPASKNFSSVSSNQIQNFSATQITHTISGTITGTDGVVVTLSGDAVGNQVVNNGGTYSFTVPEGGNYTVMPSKEGCAFTPSVGVFTNVRANIIWDFAVVLNNATIYGIVTGADSVTITLSGDASEVQTVNDGGTYTFTVPQGKNFTVTPSKTGYVFTPESKTFSGVTVNQKQDFTAARIMRTISGTVTGASGVAVTLSGGASDSRVVSADGGSYLFSVPDGGTYTVTAIKSGYTLSPQSKTFTGIAADQTLNFTAVRITHTISGTVTGANSVTVTLSGDASGTKTVSSGGSYSFTVGEGGSYTVTPSKSGYVFTPASRTFTNVTADQVLNFTAQAQVITATDVKMVSIPAGSFQMGSSDEMPVHTVTLTGFEMGMYEITQGQYRAIMSTSPSNFTGDDNLPVETVSWWDAIKFCNALSTKAGLNKCFDESKGSCDFSKNGFRLPTEAEWEYACRAGTKTYYYTGNSESDLARAGWYNGNSSSKTHPVGQKTPNAWGLYDMHGNVWEWCNDWYGSYESGSVTDPTGAQTGSDRVFRGGNWGNSADGGNCQTAHREGNPPTFRDYSIGFRVVRGAHSVPTQKYTLTMTVNTSGWGTTDPTVGTHTYDSGSSVIITANPASGYRFVNWTGSVANTSSATTTVTMSADCTVTANFEKIPVQTTDITMVSIPGGTFSMGQVGIAEPVHMVTLTGFEMSVYEVTQGQYKSIIGTNPSYFTGDDNLPVDQVSWWEAIVFCNALSAKAGLDKCYNESTGAYDFSKNGFRLPTEAEWEYACRAGTATAYNTGDNESDLARAGWYDGNSSSKTHQVGQKVANTFGLYDMHGNVWEWCNDWYGSYQSGSQTDPAGAQTGSFRVKRGGGWYDDDGYCRSANRVYDYPAGGHDHMGFRVVRRP